MQPIPWFIEPVRAALEARKLGPSLDAAGARPAAVLLMMFDDGGQPGLIFTRRSDTVRHHKGEISFPGGMQDPQDSDLRATAIRETVEELGVNAGDLDIIGELDELHTYVTGFVVKPYVAHVPVAEVYSHSINEISAVLRVPIPLLASVGREAEWEAEGHRFTTNVFEVDDNVIWGATGRILRDFLDAVAEPLGLSWEPEHAHPTERSGMNEVESIVKELAAARPEIFDWTGIYWVRGKTLELGPVVGAHPKGHERIKIPEGVCGAVAASGETEIVPDVGKRPGHIACELSTRSEVVTPIMSGGVVVGVLDVDSNKLDAFGPNEVRLIEQAAARIAELG